ncbi:hypothetical protein JOC36_000629 [Weissella uvarum]|uniref:hypothetical protein n=1 Tax=Weissella uvarum TaxID=1479233 RepID=UPI0019619AAA|nr:hypothetical protein [Weissella uvarum]MBM7617080.1 hypothetical protein [Weissella uvarum]MCM0595378.1 hypothetical protein [Weissella uvarum]
MIQPIMNDALLKALDVDELDVQNEQLHRLLADATLLVRGHETDDTYDFDLVPVNGDAQQLAIDAYTNWAQLTGDEAVFTMTFEALMYHILEVDSIQGIMLNQKHYLPKNAFAPHSKTLLAPLDDQETDDLQLEDRLAPWLEKHVKKAYLGKIIQNNEVEYALMLEPWTDDLKASVQTFWDKYRQQKPDVPQLKLVEEDSETGQFMLDHLIPIYSAK